MGIKHVAYLIALTVDTTYWGSYTDLNPHISLFCMWQQNQKEINGIFIHFTHYLSSKSLQSILEISSPYRLVSNWLSVGYVHKAWFPGAILNSFYATVFVIIIFLLNNVSIILQLLESVFMISGIIEVSVLKCYQPWPLAQLISLTANLIILDITKTSSSNCFILSAAILGLTPGNPRYFHNGTHNKIINYALLPTQEQYFSTKKLPFPLPPGAELVQMRAHVTKCSISRHSQIAIKFSSCFIKWLWNFWHLVQHILPRKLTILWHFNRYWRFCCK